MSSIIKVDTVQDQSGNNIINESGDTITIGAAGDTVDVPGTEVKTNKVSPTSGTALQIGDSGDTITIPSGATITNSGTATGFGGGKILATYQDTKTDTFSTTSSTHTDITGLISPSITPASSSSKFIVNVSIGSIGNSTGNARAFIRVVRRVSGSDTVVLAGDAAQGTETMIAYCGRNNDGTHAQASMSFTLIDSPSTASDVIYAVQVTRGSDTGTITINTTFASTDERGNTASAIVVQEVSS